MKGKNHLQVEPSVMYNPSRAGQSLIVSRTVWSDIVVQILDHMCRVMGPPNHTDDIKMHYDLGETIG